jgi:hypothetical protein
MVSDYNLLFVAMLIMKKPLRLAKIGQKDIKIKKNSVFKIEYDNLPVSGYRLVDYDHRKDNVAFKVISPDCYYFDLRLDTLMDIIREEGIVNTVIFSELIWCRVHTQMKLVQLHIKKF